MARRPFLDRFSGHGVLPRDPLAPVLRNLEAMLNTREGHGFFQQGFGLGDYSGGHGGKEPVSVLTEELKRQIAHYELRLSDVELTFKGRDGALCLQFELTAMSNGKAIRLRLYFDTVSNRVRIDRTD